MGAIVQQPIRRQNTALLSMIQLHHPGYHPILKIAEIAHTSDDLKVQLDCHKTILKYVEPELKSMELKAPPEEHRRIRVSLFDIIEVEAIECSPVGDDD